MTGAGGVALVDPGFEFDGGGGANSGGESGFEGDVLLPPLGGGVIGTVTTGGGSFGSLDGIVGGGGE